ncbi:hypothetical protein J8J21_21530, partial [Mycobacterium tuberculosis]|nr:hypothetical protein [Mycobacterium tuberculosis]
MREAPTLKSFSGRGKCLGLTMHIKTGSPSMGAAVRCQKLSDQFAPEILPNRRKCASPCDSCLHETFHLTFRIMRDLS